MVLSINVGKENVTLEEPIELGFQHLNKVSIILTVIFVKKNYSNIYTRIIK